MTTNMSAAPSSTKTPIAPPNKRQAIQTPAVENVVAPSTHPLRDLFLQVERELNATFAEREKEIRGLMIALLAREHILLLGPAGTAKSKLAEVMCGAITNATFFQYLLTRFSTPEEIFGPVSLDGLKNDRFRRVTSGKLPECNIGFLDEVYKANSAILNSLLTALNERAFDNDASRHRIPLETVVAASNELAEGPELAALHDRFLLRFWVSYTKTPDAFRRLLTGAEPSITTTISMDELHAAQAEVESVVLSNNAVDELFKLRNEVAAEGIQASDRRWRKSVRILRAAAWLDGATDVTPEAFPILANVLWETTEQIGKLNSLVSKYTSAELAEAQEAADAVLELMSSLPPKGSDTFAQVLVSTTKELKRASEKLGKLAAACHGVQSKAKIVALQNQVAAKYNLLRKDAAEALGM